MYAPPASSPLAIGASGVAHDQTHVPTDTLRSAEVTEVVVVLTSLVQPTTPSRDCTASPNGVPRANNSSNAALNAAGGRHQGHCRRRLREEGQRRPHAGLSERSMLARRPARRLGERLLRGILRAVDPRPPRLGRGPCADRRRPRQPSARNPGRYPTRRH